MRCSPQLSWQFMTILHLSLAILWTFSSQVYCWRHYMDVLNPANPNQPGHLLMSLNQIPSLQHSLLVYPILVSCFLNNSLACTNSGYGPYLLIIRYAALPFTGVMLHHSLEYIWTFVFHFIYHWNNNFTSRFPKGEQVRRGLSSGVISWQWGIQIATFTSKSHDIFRSITDGILEKGTFTIIIIQLIPSSSWPPLFQRPPSNRFFSYVLPYIRSNTSLHRHNQKSRKSSNGSPQKPDKES